jgi:hypothetical protein
VAKNEDLVESKTPSLHFLDVVPKIAQFFKKLNLEKYKLHEALYVFDEEVLSDISTLLHTCRLPHSYDSYKDVLSEKFTEYLRLSPNDMILFVDGDVYVKRYFQIETAQENVDRRACGITTQMLEGYKKRYFPNKVYRELIFELFPFVIEDVLSYKKNTPSHFKKIFIPALVNCVEIIVIGHSELDDLRSIRGLTFYLLRELFDEIMLFIAEDILFHFSNGERKAVEFLSCFSVHETIDAQGKRHKANPILDESHHAWNITTIRSTMIQHKKAKQALYEKKGSMASIKKKLDLLKKDQKELHKNYEATQKRLTPLEEKILHTRATSQKLTESEAVEVTFTEDGQEKVFQRKVLLGKLFRKEDMLIGEKNMLRRSLDEIENKLSNKQKEIDTWEKKYSENKEFLSSIEAHGYPIDKQYARILRALAKTLASR